MRIRENKSRIELEEKGGEARRSEKSDKRRGEEERENTIFQSM
jgi:hypothetical protein